MLGAAPTQAKRRQAGPRAARLWPSACGFAAIAAIFGAAPASAYHAASPDATHLWTTPSSRSPHRLDASATREPRSRPVSGRDSPSTRGGSRRRPARRDPRHRPPPRRPRGLRPGSRSSRSRATPTPASSVQHALRRRRHEGAAPRYRRHLGRCRVGARTPESSRRRLCRRARAGSGGSRGVTTVQRAHPRRSWRSSTAASTRGSGAT